LDIHPASLSATSTAEPVTAACLSPGDVSASSGTRELPGAIALHQVRRARRRHPDRVGCSLCIIAGRGQARGRSSRLSQRARAGQTAQDRRLLGDMRRAGDRARAKRGTAARSSRVVLRVVERPLCPARDVHLVCVFDPRCASPQEHQGDVTNPEHAAEEDPEFGHGAPLLPQRTSARRTGRTVRTQGPVLQGGPGPISCPGKGGHRSDH